MSISSKIALAMSADGASFEEVHNSLEKIVDEFAIGFAEFIAEKTITYYNGKFRMKTLTPVFKTSTELLEIYKKEKGL
jgi:hypothetical protein